MPDPLVRAGTLYPINSTVVDNTGTGVDVRLLSISQPGATDSTQTCTATHTQDGTTRCFDPGNAGVTTANNPFVLAKIGWALQVADMTPTDDTDCDAYIPAGTATVNISVTVNQSGGTYASGTYAPNWGVGLYTYDPSANTGTMFASGSNSATSWNLAPVGGDLGTTKTIAISVAVSPAQTFAAGQTLLLQIGFGTATIPNPSLGTATFTYTLAVDDPNTNITWATGQGVRQTCAFTNSLDGRGTASRVLATDLARAATGTGTPTFAKATTAAKTFTFDGRGTVTRDGMLAVLLPRNLTGTGTPTMTRTVVAAKSFTLPGTGTVTRVLSSALSRTPVGTGTASLTKATTAAKTFSLQGNGVVTELHPVQAFRSFSLVGKGEILITGANASTITLPIDEIPTGGGGGTTIVNQIFAVLD